MLLSQRQPAASSQQLSSQQPRTLSTKGPVPMHSLCEDHSGAEELPITTRLPLGLSARLKGPLPWGMDPDHMMKDAPGSLRLRYTTCPALVISSEYLREQKKQ